MKLLISGSEVQVLYGSPFFPFDFNIFSPYHLDSINLTNHHGHAMAIKNYPSGRNKEQIRGKNFL